MNGTSISRKNADDAMNECRKCNANGNDHAKEFEEAENVALITDRRVG